MNPVYPYSAVVGQEALKRALVLCAIDPGIGGVLVEGPRGVAKTTLARGLADLVPGAFVELPLGATEERVTGTLALDAVLREGRVEFSPGLLARAHEGVLYVDEVNLLGDSLVDVLLDAAATGRNTVERDGVSHTHPARFVLVGTMNPEEGALRPQLIDRFGLAVVADGELTPAERGEIVLRRLEFDRDPAGFVARFAKDQAQLVARCQQARALAQAIPLAGVGLERVTELCHAAQVEGVRADLAMLRAARAHAAWHERTVISAADVDAVAELALAHRRRRSHDREPPPPGSRGGSAPAQGGANGGSSQSGGSSFAGAKGPDEGSAGSTGALAAVPVRAGEPPTLPSWLVDAQGTRASTRRGGAARVRAESGARASGRGARGSIDWFGTLARAPRPRVDDLRYRARRTAPEQLWVVALDCSSSMLRGGALSVAKGVAQAIAQAAVHAGAHVALISFRGPSARTEATSSAGRAAFGQAITLLGGGGGTPLCEALREVELLCGRPTYRSRAIPKRLYLLTDGRTREPASDLLHARHGIASAVIDCERGHVRLGRARPLAQALRASYVHVDALS
jgi:magnesium chelatase subunit D